MSILLALFAGACSTAPVDVTGTFQADGLPRVDVTVVIQPEHAADADRYRYAAFTTLQILGNWLTPYPDATLSVTAGRTPWWTAAASMAPEFAVARAVSRRYWERVVDTRALPPWFVSGLAEYSARRAVSRIVDQRYLAIYRSRAEARYFGGLVPRDLRVPLRVEDQGDPIGTASTREAKALLMFGTLERWTGTPVFDAILTEFISASRGIQPSLQAFEQIADRVSGQQLSSWFFVSVFKENSVFDYALDALRSEPDADGWYRTTVVVRRRGDAFGKSITAETRFADGETIRDVWNGRGSTATFKYRSRARAVSAEVDPDRIVLLDLNHSNNGMTLDAAPARTAARRWSARWMLWLEDALLTYVALT